MFFPSLEFEYGEEKWAEWLQASPYCMNDIMTVYHGAVRFWKSSTHGAVNRTVAVACRPRVLAQGLDSMQRKMGGQQRDVCVQEHTHTHTQALTEPGSGVAEMQLLSAHFTGWSFLARAIKVADRLLLYSAVIKSTWHHLCRNFSRVKLCNECGKVSIDPVMLAFCGLLVCFALFWRIIETVEKPDSWEYDFQTTLHLLNVTVCFRHFMSWSPGNSAVRCLDARR